MVRSHARRSGISSVDDLESESVSTDRLFTNSRASDIVITTDGSTTKAVGDNAVIDSNADAGVVLQSSLDNLPASGGRITVKGGNYNFDSQVVTDKTGVILEGSTNSDVIFQATSSITSFVTFRKTGANVFRGPEIKSIRFQENGNATRGVVFDSTQGIVCSRLEFQNFTNHPIYATANQDLDTNFLTIRDCRSEGCVGLVKCEAGSSGSVTDVVLEGTNRCLQPTGWAAEFVDCRRVVINNLFAGDNSSAFSGAVRIANPDATAGSAPEVNDFQIRNVGLENQIATPSATGVLIEAPTGTNTFNRGHSIRPPHVNPEGALTSVELSSPEGGKLRNITIRDETWTINQNNPDTFIIGSGVANTKISLENESVDPLDVINDSGNRTVINLTGQNSGDPATTGQWNGNGYEGIEIWDTSNSNLYKYVNNDWRGPL